jgi:hypothetical protein
MAGKVLSIVFWLVAAFLVAFALRSGGWALVVPAATLMALMVFAVDLKRHWEIMSVDRALIRTLLHVLSAVALASSILYWLTMIVLAQ